MNIPCQTAIPTATCPGSDYPLENYSAEAPDQLYLVTGPRGNSDYKPPPIGRGNTFTAYDCYGTAFSVLSQEIADLIAQANLQYCDHPDPQDDPTDPWDPRFCNVSRTLTRNCPDGTVKTFTVGAGMFCMSTQAGADAWALAYANQQIAHLACPAPGCPDGRNSSEICLGEWSGPCTTDQSIVLSLTASGPRVDLGTGGGAGFNVWRLISGTVPTGMQLLVQNFFPIVDASGIPGGPTITLEGTPTTAGVYVFTVSVTSPIAHTPTYWTEKTYTIEVLPSVPKSAAMSVTTTKPTCAGSTKFGAAISGSLPPGLNWSQNPSREDIIAGTPTTEGTCMFSITYA